MNLEEYWNQLAYQKYNLTNCESEPLAFCGAIQDCGTFVGCKKGSDQIVAVSLNCTEQIGLTPEEGLGGNFGDFFTFADDSPFDIKQALHIAKTGPVLVKRTGRPRILIAAIFENRTLTCIDLETYDEQFEKSAGGRGVHDPVLDLKHLVHLLDSASSLEAIAQKAVEQIQQITNFDRVMIYKFQPNWDGQVIAEVIKGEYPPYLDLFYPASDIPAQARKLYFESKFRMIVDSEALPVPIATKKGIGKSEIDLSCSAFRASSPIHIQYLKNMGVRTSFSVPIKLNGELWGLVACHGYGEPIKPTRQQRAACELAAQVLSGRIADSVSERRLKIRNEVFQLTQALLATVSEGESAVTAFKAQADQLLRSTESAGAYVRIGGDSITLGKCPPTEFITSLTEKLAGKPSLALYETQCLQTEMFLDHAVDGVGALAVPLSLGFGDVVIWFRPEFVHEVKWGGKPAEQAELVKSLEPRSSFAAWSQMVKGKSRVWSDSDREAAQFILFTFVQGIFKKAADLSRANVELERATKAKDEFIGMVSHELRTPLGIMIGWIDVLKDYQFRDAEVNQALETIDRNAKHQINLINDLLDVSRIISGKMKINPEPNVDAGMIAKDAVDSLLPTANSKNIKLVCECGSANLISADPERLRQIIWNLITNAIKFTQKGGHITVKTVSKASSVEISITDDGIGIPPDRIGSIFNRFEQIGENGARTGGLGLGLSIVKSLVELHGGRIQAYSRGEGTGSAFTVILPIYALREHTVASTTVTLKSDLSAALKGLRILLAEDQQDSSTAMGHMLRRQGAVVTVANNGREAFEELKHNTFDLLLSDIGMPEWDGYRLITTWRELEKERQAKALPAVALTAFATSQDRIKALQAGFQNHIAKPVDKNELVAVIQSLTVKIN